MAGRTLKNYKNRGMNWPYIKGGDLMIPLGSWGNGIPLGFLGIVVAVVVGVIILVALAALSSKRREAKQ
jgi:hypothetical protein